MYLEPAITMVVEALRSTFDATYPEPDFIKPNISIDFPMTQQSYPCIWVQFSDNQPLQRAGIDHHEVITETNGSTYEITRFRFGGDFTFTVAALSSLEMVRLYDQLVRVLGFVGVDDQPANDFRTQIENNDLIDLLFDNDVLSPTGQDATPGTPWDTREVIYEKSLSIGVIGTFASSPTAQLVPLSKISVAGYMEGDEPSDFPDLSIQDPSEPYSPTQWI